MATGTGWKPVVREQRLVGSIPAPSAVAGSGVGDRKQTVNLPVGGSIPLGHPVTRACSWESNQPPKLMDRVRILTLVLNALWV